MLSILTCSCSLSSSLARSRSLCSSRGPVSMIAAAPAHKICHFPILSVKVCTFDNKKKQIVGTITEYCDSGNFVFDYYYHSLDLATN